MRTIEAQAAALRAMLAAATGAAARSEAGPMAVRIEADLPDELSTVARRAVLTALSLADRYGHTRTSRGDLVWAELDTETTT